MKNEDIRAILTIKKSWHYDEIIVLLSYKLKNNAMNIEQVRDFTLSLFGVTEDQPFGDDNITFRVEGKIFLCLWLGYGTYSIQDSRLRFACKLCPDRNDELREQNEAITPAFHWNKKHWSDVFFEQLETEFVEAIIRESYGVIVSKLPKTTREKYKDYAATIC